MIRITYKDLELFFGKHGAKVTMQTVERMANIKSEIVALDQEARWQTALDALNDIDFSNRI